MLPAHPLDCLLCFFNDPATTAIYTLSLHDALPIYVAKAMEPGQHGGQHRDGRQPDEQGEEKLLGPQNVFLEHVAIVRGVRLLASRQVREAKGENPGTAQSKRETN